MWRKGSVIVGFALVLTAALLAQDRAEVADAPVAPTTSTRPAAQRPTTRLLRFASTQPTTRIGTAKRPTTRLTRAASTRPTLTDAEAAELAARLRETYFKPSDQWPEANVPEGVAYHELSQLPPPPFPEDNPYSKPKADLGRQLYFDPRLSGSGQIACASCHDADLGFADGRTVSFGHGRQALKRNAPSLMNAAYGKTFFWDGRAASLEDQALAPLLAGDEMAADAIAVMRRLNEQEGYRQQAKAVFGTEELTVEQMTQSLATFQRTLVAGRSKFDRFLAGQKDALSDPAIRGLHLFRTDAMCIRCHNGPNFTDNQFHDVGLSYYGRKLEDLGRYNVTKDAKDVGAFKTPSLRNVTRTAPYMHVGLFDLDGVLNLYNVGMPTIRRRPDQANDPLFPTKSDLLEPIGLTPRDKDDLKAFMEALEEPRIRLRPPPLPGLTTQPSRDEDAQ